jgi:hypothetical protein
MADCDKARKDAAPNARELTLITQRYWKSKTAYIAMFLVPIAVVGYSIWEKNKKERDEKQLKERPFCRATTDIVRSLEVVPPTSDTAAHSPAIGSALTSDSLETCSLGDSVNDGSELSTNEPCTAQPPECLGLIKGAGEACVLQEDTPLDGGKPDCENHVEEKLSIAGGEPETKEIPGLLPPEPPSAPHSEGPFHGLVQFIREQQRLFAENQDPWRIKPNADTLTYEVLGHQGKRKE